MINDKLKQALKEADEAFTRIKGIQSLSGDFSAEYEIDDIISELGTFDDFSLKTEKELEQSLDRITGDPDLRNDLFIDVERIVRETLTEKMLKFDKDMREVIKKLSALQEAIDADLDIETDPLKVLDQLEWQDLGTHGEVYVLPQDEQIRLFAPGAYLPLHDNPPAKFVPLGTQVKTTKTRKAK